ncbi:MAG: GAF and ANTAR domain-containing protein [Actinomycetes bacterium]
MTTSGDEAIYPTQGQAPHAQAELAEVFVALADTLVDDFDIIEFLNLLTQTCVDLLGAGAAGILLADTRGLLRVMGASSETAQLLELLQLQDDHGPCVESVRTGRPLAVTDLGSGSTRWPDFAAAATFAGFRAMDAVPMRLRSDVIGGLNVFHTTTEPFNPDQLRIATALADTATIGLLQHRALQRSTVVGEQLQTALNSRIVLEQAKGMIAEYANIGVDRAFERLRQHARNNNRKLTDVARDVVERRLRLDGTDSSA